MCTYLLQPQRDTCFLIPNVFLYRGARTNNVLACNLAYESVCADGEIIERLSARYKFKMEDLELTLEKNNSNEFFDSNEEKTELEEGRLHLVLCLP